MERRKFRWILLKQAMLQKKTKALLIVLAVGMGASVLAALLNLNSDLRYRMNRELRDYGPNVILLPDAKSNQTYLDANLLPQVQTLQADGRILAFTPQLFVPAEIHGQRTILVGADLIALRKLYPAWKWNGNSTGILMGVRLARKLKANPGGEVSITTNNHSRSITVAGAIESGGAEDDQVFTDLTTAQSMSGISGRFQIISISALGDVAAVEKEFSEFIRHSPGVTFQVLRKIAEAETTILDKISRLIALVTSIIFLILFFCIQTTVSAILLSRQSEIALFRVLGARRKQIMYELSLELLTLGFIGGILGYLVGLLMAQLLGKVLFQTYILPHAGTFIITILFSLLMMIVSSIWPIQRAVNRQAAIVLKEA